MIKNLITVIFFLLVLNYNCYSQNLSIDLHIPKIRRKEIKFYDFKYKMRERYYSKFDMLNWSELRLGYNFIIYNKNMEIRIGLNLPPILQEGINFK
jgi:hypothetical protein